MAIDNPFYTAELHGPYELVGLGDFELEEGGVIPGLEIAVSTHGTLNAARDNCILVPTWYSGTHQIMEQVYIGPGRALDPADWFIVVANQIGNGLSSSPHNVTGPHAGPAFPRVRIGDDVRAQERLLRERFRVEELALVVGGSMGAQQTWEWAVRYPDRVRRAAPIAGTAQNTHHDFLYTQTLMDALTADPGWQGGAYASHLDVAEGLRMHGRIAAVMGWSTEWYKQELWRRTGEFPTFEDFTREFTHGYHEVLDPNSLLTMGWKWQHADAARSTGGDLAAALGRIEAVVYAMPISEDMFFPPRDVAAEVALVPKGELRVIESLDGHMGLIATDPGYLPQVEANLRELLAREA
ncbi:MAG: alpha/beta fold hydrolase [Actinomycetota bacterium]